MEVDKIISCNLIFKDGSKMEIKPANSMVLKRESYCSNCGKHVPFQFWIYCPYCGKEKICDTEFDFIIPEEAAKKIKEKENKNG